MNFELTDEQKRIQALAREFYEGTSHIQRVIIARELVRRDG